MARLTTPPSPPRPRKSATWPAACLNPTHPSQKRHSPPPHPPLAAPESCRRKTTPRRACQPRRMVQQRQTHHPTPSSPALPHPSPSTNPPGRTPASRRPHLAKLAPARREALRLRPPPQRRLPLRHHPRRLTLPARLLLLQRLLRASGQALRGVRERRDTLTRGGAALGHERKWGGCAKPTVLTTSPLAQSDF